MIGAQSMPPHRRRSPSPAVAPSPDAGGIEQKDGARGPSGAPRPPSRPGAKSKDARGKRNARGAVAPLARRLVATLLSHDCVPRCAAGTGEASLPRHRRALERAFASPPRVLYAAYRASSFTYTAVGLAMLLHFNRRLPDPFVRAAVVDVNAYAAILVAQGFFSYWADVYARTVLRVPEHPAYLADRAFATPMTILTLYLGIFCWAEHSDDVGRSLAAASALGLVPLAGSQLALRRGRFVAFMALHVLWHLSIPLVAVLWLGHTACGWFA